MFGISVRTEEGPYHIDDEKHFNCIIKYVNPTIFLWFTKASEKQRKEGGANRCYGHDDRPNVHRFRVLADDAF